MKTPHILLGLLSLLPEGQTGKITCNSRVFAIEVMGELLSSGMCTIVEHMHKSNQLEVLHPKPSSPADGVVSKIIPNTLLSLFPTPADLYFLKDIVTLPEDKKKYHAVTVRFQYQTSKHFLLCSPLQCRLISRSTTIQLIPIYHDASEAECPSNVRFHVDHIPGTNTPLTLCVLDHTIKATDSIHLSPSPSSPLTFYYLSFTPVKNLMVVDGQDTSEDFKIHQVQPKSFSINSHTVYATPLSRFLHRKADHFSLTHNFSNTFPQSTKVKYAIQTQRYLYAINRTNTLEASNGLMKASLSKEEKMKRDVAQRLRKYAIELRTLEANYFDRVAKRLKQVGNQMLLRVLAVRTEEMKNARASRNSAIFLAVLQKMPYLIETMADIFERGDRVYVRVELEDGSKVYVTKGGILIKDLINPKSFEVRTAINGDKSFGDDAYMIVNATHDIGRMLSTIAPDDSKEEEEYVYYMQWAPKGMKKLGQMILEAQNRQVGEERSEGRSSGEEQEKLPEAYQNYQQIEEEVMEEPTQVDGQQREEPEQGMTEFDLLQLIGALLQMEAGERPSNGQEFEYENRRLEGESSDKEEGAKSPQRHGEQRNEPATGGLRGRQETGESAMNPREVETQDRESASGLEIQTNGNEEEPSLIKGEEEKTPLPHEDAIGEEEKEEEGEYISLKRVEPVMEDFLILHNLFISDAKMLKGKMSDPALRYSSLILPESEKIEEEKSFVTSRKELREFILRGEDETSDLYWGGKAHLMYSDVTFWGCVRNWKDVFSVKKKMGEKWFAMYARMKAEKEDLADKREVEEAKERQIKEDEEWEEDRKRREYESKYVPWYDRMIWRVVILISCLISVIVVAIRRFNAANKQRVAPRYDTEGLLDA